MDDSLCDTCKHVFATQWRRFSVLGSHDTNKRPGWHRNLSRVCHFRPCLVYKGKISDLKPDDCRMCYSLQKYFSDSVRRGRNDGFGVSKDTLGSKVIQAEPTLLNRLWNSIVSIRLYENDQNFRMRFELLIPESRVIQVDLRAGHMGNLWFKLYADSDSPIARSIPGRPSLWDTASEVTFTFIRRCIAECNSSHKCLNLQTDQDNRRAPKRLIQIKVQQGSIQAKLIDTNTVSNFPQYCTLSYVWGNPSQHRQVKTLKANIGDHKNCIDVATLPGTVRDAMTCCQQLSLQYLWVDALCMIQDDDGDKMSEIAAMGDIYSNSYMTIAASSAEGSSDGFLEPRENPFFSAPIPFSNSLEEVKWAIRSNGMLNSSNMVTLRDGKMKLAKNCEPLHFRGWTFQEAMLSKRILFYSFFQPYWICKETACSGGDPAPREYFTAIGLREMFESLSQSSKGTTMEETDLGYRWPWVAEQYSSRVLSVLEDKPLAIHSIKDKYQYGSSPYVSGIWLENLNIDLLWSTTTRHSRTEEEIKKSGSKYSRGRIVDIPSWSWLSFDGSVRFDLIWHAYHRGKIHHISDISGKVQPIYTPTTDEFGRLTGKPLRLCGLTKKLVIIPPIGRSWGNRIQERSCYDIKVWNEAKSLYTMKMTERAVLGFRIGEAVFDDYVEPPKGDGGLGWTRRRESYGYGENYEVAPTVLECLLVSLVGDRTGAPIFDGKPRGYTRPTQGNETAYGLLLQDIPGTNGDQKRRLGFFRGDEGLSYYFDDAVECEFDFELCIDIKSMYRSVRRHASH